MLIHAKLGLGLSRGDHLTMVQVEPDELASRD